LVSDIDPKMLESNRWSHH